MENDLNVGSDQKKFRFNSAQVFLTYSQCDLSRESVLDFLHTRGRVLQAVIAQETHKDLGLHIHAYVKYQKRIDVTNPRHFDIKQFHPKIEAVRSVHAVQKYVQKEDKDVLQFNIDIEQVFSAKKAHKRAICKQLLEGAKLCDVVDENPEMLYEYDRIQRNLALYKTDKARLQPDLVGFIPNPWGLLMPIKTDTKQKHYWIWSRMPNTGKTTKFLLPLQEKARCSFYNYQENFQEVFSDSQFVLFDEFSTAHLKVTNINMMCDGTYQYPRKSSSPVTVKAIMIICGNKHPNEIYPKAFEYIQARFNVLCVDKEKLAFSSEWPMMTKHSPVKHDYVLENERILAELESDNYFY
jgi:hypothetical protein